MKAVFSFLFVVVLFLTAENVYAATPEVFPEVFPEVIIELTPGPLHGPLLFQITSLPDETNIYLDDPFFRETFHFVMECESHKNPTSHRFSTIQSVSYEVIGAMQLLYDSKIREITGELGFVKDDLYKLGPNVLVAQEWFKRNKGWYPWYASKFCWSQHFKFPS